MSIVSRGGTMVNNPINLVAGVSLTSQPFSLKKVTFYGSSASFFEKTAFLTTDGRTNQLMHLLTCYFWRKRLNSAITGIWQND